LIAKPTIFAFKSGLFTSFTSTTTFLPVFLDSKFCILSRFSPVLPTTNAVLIVYTTTVIKSCSIEIRISHTGISFSSFFKRSLIFKSNPKSFLYDFLLENQEPFQVFI
jgi:hypothetical protein